MAISPIVKAADSSLECPVDFEPLKEAVMLSCGHTINKTPAVRLFGLVVAGKCTLANKTCPICVQVVTHYTANYLVRELAARMQDAVEKKRPLELPEKCPEVEVKKARLAPAYPGFPAKFIHNGGDWKPFDSGSQLRKRLEFASLCKDSLLKKFSLLEYDDKSVKLLLNFKKDRSELFEYFRNFDLILSKFDVMTGSYKTETKEQLRTLFALIAQNNEIPASHYKKVKKIVEESSAEVASHQ